jgi:hypothetical protein
MPPSDPISRIQRALDKGGIPGAERAIERARKQAEAAQGPFAKLAEVLDDPRIRRAAGNVLALENATRKLNEQARERLTLEARRAAVLSGTYGRELRAQQQINKERERVEAMERRAQFAARYGRFGGLLYAADTLRRDPWVRGAMGAATAIGGAATAGGMKGFQGTVEWNRFNLELELVSRELAGAFRPALQLVTTALQKLRAGMERMSVRQQNLVMLGGLAFGGLAAAGLARMGLMGLAGGLGAGGAAAAGAAGGLLSRGRLVGMAGAGAVAYGAATDNPYAGFLGGAALGSRFGPIGAAIGSLTGGATSAPSDRTGERPSEYWTRMRREGHDMVGSTLAVMGRSVARLFGSSPDPAGGPDGANPDRRRVTIADAGFEATGTARDRLTTALAMVDAAGSRSERDILEDIWEFMKTTFGAGGTPAPPTL